MAVVFVSGGPTTAFDPKRTLPVDRAIERNQVLLSPNTSFGDLMSLSDIAAIGSLVGGAAVLVSLVYLAQQVRQSATNQSAAVHQGRSSTVTDLLIRLSEPSLSRTFLRAASGDREIPAEEFYQYLNMFGAILMSWEDQFAQHKSGMLSDDRFFGTSAAVMTVLQLPGNYAAWKVYAAPLFAADFREYVESRIVEGRAVEQRDVLADWKAQLDSEEASTPRKITP